MILGKAVGSGGGGDLYAAELINQSLIDKFKEKHVVVKYVRGIFFKKRIENKTLFLLKINLNKICKGISGQTEEKTLQYFHDEIAINWYI